MHAPAFLPRHRGSISRLAALTALLALVPAVAVVGSGSATAAGASPGSGADPTIGTVTTAPPAAARLTTAEEEVYGGLQLVVNERGRISRSIAAVGTFSYEPVPLTVEKPVGATVRSAYLAFASRGNSFMPLLEPPLLEGAPVELARETPSPMGAYNYFAEVTDQVASTIDAAPAGPVDVMLTETDPYQHEASVLVVVFDDPSVAEPRSVSLLYGAINPDGDTYGVTLTEPIDKADPDTHMDMSLGISYGYQQAGTQYSTIDVNGQRLTSAAGGADDGLLGNGALVTAGGVGDSLDNPADPFALPLEGERSDDELYDLLPFVRTGDTRVQIATDNPSHDDNVFLATLTMNPPVRGVTTDGDTLQVTPELQGVPVGFDARWEAALPDGALTGFDAPFRAEITAGPNAGKQFGFGCAPVTCFTTFGPVPLALHPQEPFAAGTDLVHIWFDADRDDFQDSDEEFADVGVRWLDPADQVAMGDSYSSGEGVDPYDSGTDDDWGDNRNQCHRSEHAWGRLVVPDGYAAPLLDYVDQIGTSVVMVACSGATTHDVERGGGPQYPGEGASQVDQGALSDATDLVTISIGGNDVGFSRIVTACARNGCAAGEINGEPVFDFAEDALTALPGRLDLVLPQIKDEAPNATVVLLGYPRLFSDTAEERDTCPVISNLWDAESQDWMNQKAYEVSAIMSAAAARNGVFYLSPISVFDNHEICGSEGEWLNGLTTPNPADLFHESYVGTGSFHPNEEGHADGYAAIVNDFLAQAAVDGLPSNAAGLPVNPVPTGFAALVSTVASSAAVVATVAADPLPSVGELEVTQVPGRDTTGCLPEGLVGAARTTRVWGDGFAPGSEVSIVWEDASGVETELGRAAASASGQVATVVTTPAGGEDTFVRMYARGVTDDGRSRELARLLGVAARSCPGSEPVYAFDGFYAPVDNLPVVNQMKAGRAVPVSFSLGGDHGLDVFAEGSPSSRRIDCATGAPVDLVETTLTAGSSSLTYDAATDRYQYVWKTSSAWAGSCRELTVRLDDGSEHRAVFSMR